MRVVLDARAAIAASPTGVGQYTVQMIRRLPLVDPETRYVAWHPSSARLVRPRAAPAGGRPSNLTEHVVPVPAPVFDRAAIALDVPRVEWTTRFDVLFAPNFFPPPTRSPRVVLTVHDLAFRRLPDLAHVAKRRWRRRLEAALPRAARVIAVSDQTRLDLAEIYAVPIDRIRVIPLGVDTDVFRPDAPALEAGRFGVAGRYVLALGTIDPRKNLEAVLHAYASLDPVDAPALVVAGDVAPWDPAGSSKLRAAIERVPRTARDRVVVTGYVSEPDKVALLRGAEVLVYPSLYEGFGLPILEAMACGTPVITSNVSALPDTAGDAAFLVDPRDDDALAEALGRLLTDAALRSSLRRAGLERARAFPWTRTAERTAGVLHEVNEDL